MPRIKTQSTDFVSILDIRAQQLEIDMAEKNNGKDVGNLKINECKEIVANSATRFSGIDTLNVQSCRHRK